MITVEVRYRIISLLWLHFFHILVVIFLHIWTIFFPIKDWVQLVVQIMHLMLKVHHSKLSLCKLPMQIPLSTVLHSTYGTVPISFYSCCSGMVVCCIPLACSCGRLGTGGLQLLSQSY